MRHTVKMDRLLATTALGLTVLLPAATAMGQGTQTAQAAQTARPASGPIEEIVVTARRTEETLQNVPVAVTALTAADLEKRNVVDINDIGRYTPNTYVTRSPQGGSDANFAIRGIRQDDFIVSADPAVGIYVDGVYLGRTVGSGLDALDLARVEVLRGPQGTLFGRNTIAGAVSLVTQKPSHETQGRIEGTVGSRDLYRVRGSVTGSIVPDILAARAAISYTSQDGPGESVYFPGQTAGDVDDLAGRVAFLLTPGDDLEVYLTADATQGRGTTRHTINRGASLTAAPFPFFGPPLRTLPADINNDRSNDLYRDFRSVNPINDSDIYGTALTITYQVTDSIEVKSISAYRDLEATTGQDYDATGYRAFDQVATTEQNQFSQEFQLNGTALDGRVTFATGLYYFTEDFSQLLPMNVRQLGPRLDTRVFTNRQAREGTNESYAAYGQATVDITRQLSATLGIRYSLDDKELTLNDAFVNNLGFPITLPFPPFPVLFQQGVNTTLPRTTVDSKFPSWTPRLGLEYQATDDVLVYGHWSKGFKSGGFNGRPQGSASAIQPFDPEEVDSFEVGLKSRLLEDRLQANIAVFYMDYQNIQSVIQQAGTFTITNAAAEIQGFEAELIARPVDALTLTAGIGYTDSEYTDVPVGLPYRSGNVLPLAPEWTVNAAAEYVVALDAMGDVSLRGEWVYTGDQYFQATNFPAELQEGYSLFNFRVTWTNADGNLSVAGYVQNAFEEEYFTFGQDASAGFGPSYVFVGDPREWGLTLTVRF